MMCFFPLQKLEDDESKCDEQQILSLRVLHHPQKTLTLPKQRTSETNKLPPGPKGLPVLGNLHQLKLPAHKTLNQLSHRYGSSRVTLLRLGSVNLVVVSSSDAAKDLYKNNDLAFASRPPTILGKYFVYNYKDMVLAPYGDQWRLCRKVCVLQLLTIKQVASFAPVRRQEVDLMVQNIWDNSHGGTVTVDVTEAMESVTANIIWRILCSRKFRADEEIANGMTFRRLVVEVLKVGGEFNVGDFFPWLDWIDIQGIKRRMKKLHLFYDFFAQNILSERLQKRSDKSPQQDGGPPDFLDILLDNEFEHDTIKSLLFDMAAGGTETSTTTMEWAMSLMLKLIGKQGGTDLSLEEEHLDKLKYLQCVVKETMRLYPALPLGFPHSSMEDSVLCGYDVPKGTMLFINIWAIGRDPEVWEDAEEFRPERFLNDIVVDLHGQDQELKWIPFGSGRRGCPGASMAIPIMILTLATLVHGFDWTVPGGELDMTEEVGITAPRKTHLMAVPHRRF